MSFSSALTAAAQAAYNAMYASDGSINASACSQVCVSGTTPNSAVHAFKVAWNTEGFGSDDASQTGNGAQTSLVSGADASFGTIGSLGHNGQYDDAAAQAIGAVLSISPAQPCASPCSGGVTPPPPTPPGPNVTPSGGMPGWLKLILAVLAVGAVIFAGTMLYKRSKKRGGLGASEPRRRRNRKTRRPRRRSKRR
jgi:hypothetical protein